MRKYNYAVSVVMTAIAGYIFYETASYSSSGVSAQQDSAIWPRVLAAGLIICSIILAVQTVFTKKASESMEPVINWKSEGMQKVYLALGFIAAFLILTQIIGMLLAFLVLIPGILWIMQCKSKLMYIAIPVGVVVFIYVFFYLIMSVRFPQPFWA